MMDQAASQMLKLLEGTRTTQDSTHTVTKLVSTKITLNVNQNN